MESAPAPSDTPRPADLHRLGRYRIVRPLSKGGMALVYEARRESLAGVSPRVAIKLILPEHAASETYKDLFVNEARLGASMHHQNLVQIQDFDCEGDNWFLVMEYVEGLTLRRIIQLAEYAGGSIPLGVVAEIGRQACDGLHYAHTAADDRGLALHLVHRDMKPSNLILSPHGVVKVLDFGISKGRLREERKGSVRGTWGYMAPEQAVGAEVRPTADVFGLAVVLYELAALRPMFVDQDKETIRRLLRDDHAARMAATLDGGLYGPLIGVLVRALQRDPAARFDSCASFARALSGLLPDPVTARDEAVRFHAAMADIESRARSPGGTPAPAGATPQLAARAKPATPPVVTTVAAGAAVSLALVATLATLVLFGATAALWDTPRAPSPVAVAAGTTAAGVRGDGVPSGEGLAAGRTDPALARDEPAGPAGEGAPGERSGPPHAASGTAAPEPASTEPARGRERGLPRAAPSVTGSEPGLRVAGLPSGDGLAADDGALVPVPESQSPAPAPQGPTSPVLIDARQAAEVYIDGRFVAATPAHADLSPGRYTVSIVASDGRRRTFDLEVEEGDKVKKTWDFDRMEWR